MRRRVLLRARFHRGLDQRLARLISDYQDNIRTAMALLGQAGIARPESNIAWACNGIPQRGMLPGDIASRKHGDGCAVMLPAGEIDFDFGTNGEFDGFDAWRLAGFAGSRLDAYGFASSAALEACFKQEVQRRSIVRSVSGLYYLARR
jgi:hypothetical protein